MIDTKDNNMMSRRLFTFHYPIHGRSRVFIVFYMDSIEIIENVTKIKIQKSKKNCLTKLIEKLRGDISYVS